LQFLAGIRWCVNSSALSSERATVSVCKYRVGIHVVSASFRSCISVRRSLVDDVSASFPKLHVSTALVNNISAIVLELHVGRALLDDSAIKGKYVFSVAGYNLWNVETSKEE